MKKSVNTAIIILSIFIGALFAGHFWNSRSTFYGDGLGYYLYLPSTFIYHNHTSLAEYPTDKQIPAQTLSMLDGLKNNLKSPKGYILNQYTYGVALMELPFFLMAHTYEQTKRLPANGFSEHYNIMMKAATLFYALLGLYILFLALKRFFPSTHILLGLSIIALGTNFLWFTVVQAGMAHIMLFFLVASLLYCTIRIYESPKPIYFILLGLITGLIVLIRPTDIIVLLIPLLYKVYNSKTFKEKLNFINRHKWMILLAALSFILVWLPQFFYWKALTGQYLFYSYGNQSFDWLHPHLLAGLFSYGNGWLAYSPVMLFSIAGLFFLNKGSKSFRLMILLILPIYVYIIYSWYCYNYINGFGSRPMINIYPLLAIPLVGFIQYIAQQKRIIAILAGTLIVFLSAISYSYAVQQAMGNLASDNSNQTFNMHTLFRYKLDYNDLVCNDNEIIQPDTGKLKFVETLDSENFEQADSSKQIRFDSLSQSHIYVCADGQEYVDRVLSKKVDQASFPKAKWIKCSGMFNAPEYCGTYDNQLMVLEVKRGDEMILWKSCKVNNKIGLATQALPKEGFHLSDIRTKIWGLVYFYIPLPKDLHNGDIINFRIWNIGKKELLLDNLSLDLYQ